MSLTGRKAGVLTRVRCLSVGARGSLPAASHVALAVFVVFITLLLLRKPVMAKV
jgi:hypothetical protein